MAHVELDGVCAAGIADQAHVSIEQWECQVRLGPQNVAATGTYLHIGTHDEERVLVADRQHRARRRRRREKSQPHIPQPRRTLAQRGRIHHHPGIAGRGDALDNRPHRSRGLLLSTLTSSLTFSRAFGRSSLSFTYSGSQPQVSESARQEILCWLLTEMLYAYRSGLTCFSLAFDLPFALALAPPRDLSSDTHNRAGRPPSPCLPLLGKRIERRV